MQRVHSKSNVLTLDSGGEAHDGSEDKKEVCVRFFGGWCANMAFVEYCIAVEDVFVDAIAEFRWETKKEVIRAGLQGC
jgi:hypothetical protein